MARFANDCMVAFNKAVRNLENSLGPETGDLMLRVGLHSGPVTAGVLRGDKARFQLFGDTVNTCARIESGGSPNRIHLSEETANLLVLAGKEKWLVPRENEIFAKGKGKLKTYWLDLKGRNSESGASGSRNSESSNNGAAEHLEQTSFQTDSLANGGEEKCRRLINWNADILGQILRQIEARRQACGTTPASESSLAAIESFCVGQTEGLVLDEVKEVIRLPRFDQATAKLQPSIELKHEVVSQLWDFVHAISRMYRDNPFHNFEHASHVAMSVSKLLSRIVAPSLEDIQAGTDEENVHQSLHDYTFGITSDPLTQFACVLSALIHDVDHQGVPNAQLVQEQSPLAAVYNNKSVAEQNSVDIAWGLLMQDRFTGLRRAIYRTEDEFTRFRQLVVNSVMATDIMDKELKALRNDRWDKAFSQNPIEEPHEEDNVNRKATIVIEHLIQASDVAHTMQHWHIYRKWNERLFVEMYKAYKEGRSTTYPADGWYKGEMGFFDFYIIPLTQKLKDCGVFGVSSEEYLTYALQNRREWEIKGQTLVNEMVEKTSRMEFSENQMKRHVEVGDEGSFVVETIEV